MDAGLEGMWITGRRGVILPAASYAFLPYVEEAFFLPLETDRENCQWFYSLTGGQLFFFFFVIRLAGTRHTSPAML